MTMKNDTFTCKVCGGKIKLICKCARRDSICENGCSYHWSPFHKEYHLGQSDHSTDTLGENCCLKKEKINDK